MGGSVAIRRLTRKEGKTMTFHERIGAITVLKMVSKAIENGADPVSTLNLALEINEREFETLFGDNKAAVKFLKEAQS